MCRRAKSRGAAALAAGRGERAARLGRGCGGPARYAGPERILLQGDDEDFDNTVFVVPPETQRLSVLYCGSGSEKDPAQPLYFLRRAFQETRRQAVQVVIRQPGADAGPNPALAGALGCGPRVADALRRHRPAAGGAGGGVAQPGGRRQDRPLRPEERCARKYPGDRARPPRPCPRGGLPRDYAILGEIDFRHPLFAPFADPRFNDFSKIHFWKYRRLDAGAIPSARPLAKFDSGDPALIEVPLGRGRVLILTSGWQPEDSQLALSTKFVPLLYAMLEQSGAPAPLPTQYHVGDIIPLAAGGSWGDKSERRRLRPGRFEDRAAGR